MSLVTAYIALGSNLGDRLEQMQQALKLLQSDYGVRVLRTSPVYQNRAVGMGDAEDFLNAVACVETECSPEGLLDACLRVEAKLGRTRGTGWAPRSIDLDLLLYEGVELGSERLTLPHPRIAERDFVAKPLLDVAPDLIVFEKPIQKIVEALPALDLQLIDVELFASDF